MNPGLELLQPYPFERLAALRAELHPPEGLTAINMSIGEPQHPTPAFIHDALRAAQAGTGKYPATRGTAELRESITAWLSARFELAGNALDPDRHVLPVNGTREALFSIAQCVIDPRLDGASVVMPNPFYQIYEGAALLAGAAPVYVPCPADNGFIPDFDSIPAATWDRCQLLYICTPGNPSGSVMSAAQIESVIELADRHNFTIVSDECYSELYFDEARPPVGLLQVAWAMGRTDFRRCIVMHSLSKRSNAPGLRSGFAAGDPLVLAEYLRYRTYHGCAMPLQVQAASAAAWRDEEHVAENRALYREKFSAVVPILRTCLDITIPPAGFYLWPSLPLDDVTFCRTLIEEQNVITLPGRFLARDDSDGNPGERRVRIVLTDDIATCIAGANRITAALKQLQ